MCQDTLTDTQEDRMEATMIYPCTGAVVSHNVGGGVVIHTRRAGPGWAAWAKIPGVPASGRYVFLAFSETAAVAHAQAQGR